MKRLQLLCVVAAAGWLAGGVAGADRAAGVGEGTASGGQLPPVLRPTDPPDSFQVTLPGPPPASSTLKKQSPIPPVPTHAPVPARLVEDASLRLPVRLPVIAPMSINPAPVVEASDPAAYCQRQIGRWKDADARKLLGEPKRRRPAYDEKKAVNGAIYAFEDPTGKYKELELDFDSKTGRLRTVFLYPPKLTWQECRRQWTGPVSTADAAQGRKFYSYTNRRLDVLVDPAGKVISLGWY